MKINNKLNELQKIFSGREIEVVRKRLQNKHITQIESNYLSRSIRPKLKAAQIAASLNLLYLLDYRRKKYERENNIIKNKILDSLGNILKSNTIRSIILYGSYVQNHHTNYRDIDVMIVLKKKIWKTSTEKYRLEKKIEKDSELNIDVDLVLYRDLIKTLPYSPLLHTELESYEVIYGDFKINRKIILNKNYLYVKLLEIEKILELGKDIKTKNIYNALRTCLSIKLFLKKIINNKLIINEIIDNIGILTTESLIENKANDLQREIALRYLCHLYKTLELELR